MSYWNISYIGDKLRSGISAPWNFALFSDFFALFDSELEVIFVSLIMTLAKGIGPIRRVQADKAAGRPFAKSAFWHDGQKSEVSLLHLPQNCWSWESQLCSYSHRSSCNRASILYWENSSKNPNSFQHATFFGGQQENWTIRKTRDCCCSYRFLGSFPCLNQLLSCSL